MHEAKSNKDNKAATVLARSEHLSLALRPLLSSNAPYPRWQSALQLQANFVIHRIRNLQGHLILCFLAEASEPVHCLFAILLP